MKICNYNENCEITINGKNFGISVAAVAYGNNTKTEIANKLDLHLIEILLNPNTNPAGLIQTVDS